MAPNKTLNPDTGMMPAPQPRPIQTARRGVGGKQPRVPRAVIRRSDICLREWLDRSNAITWILTKNARNRPVPRAVKRRPDICLREWQERSNSISRLLAQNARNRPVSRTVRRRQPVPSHPAPEDTTSPLGYTETITGVGEWSDEAINVKHKAGKRESDAVALSKNLDHTVMDRDSPHRTTSVEQIAHKIKENLAAERTNTDPRSIDSTEICLKNALPRLTRSQTARMGRA
ncbi:hypothetical protein BJX64DRAFT_282741 [Aspergillus heterothallicus]